MIAAAPVAQAGAARSRLHLGRIEFAISVARAGQWPAPWTDAERFRRDAASVLEQSLAPLLDDADPSVWIIRRLDLVSLVDGGSDRAAHAFAAALRNAIARALRGEDGGGIIRFPNRAAYLARLLAEVARGDGFERWYHFRYRHLAALPLPDALVHILAADPDTSAEALAELHAARQLDGMLDALGERGARRVLAMLARAEPALAPPSDLNRIATPEQVRAVVAVRSAGACARLALLAGAIRTPALAVPVLAAAADTLIRAEAAHRPSAMPRGGVSATPPRAGPEPGAIAAAAPRKRGRSARGPDPAALRPRAPRHAAEAETIDTPFAGIFLLWRSVVELGLERLLPAGADGNTARLTLAATLAGREWRAAFDDPALRWLAGVDDPDAQPARASPGLAAAFARHMAERAAPRPLRLAEQRAGAICVIQDEATEDWIHLLGVRAKAGRGLILPHAIPLADRRARPVSRDLVHFGVDARTPAGRLPWILLARAAFADFARRLTGLERSSSAWLAANLIVGQGRVTFGDPPEVLLPGVPLDLVLRMTGIDRTIVAPAHGPAYRLCLPERG